LNDVSHINTSVCFYQGFQFYKVTLRLRDIGVGAHDIDYDGTKHLQLLHGDIVQENGKMNYAKAY